MLSSVCSCNFEIHTDLSGIPSSTGQGYPGVAAKVCIIVVRTRVNLIPEPGYLAYCTPLLHYRYDTLVSIPTNDGVSGLMGQGVVNQYHSIPMGVPAAWHTSQACSPQGSSLGEGLMVFGAHLDCARTSNRPRTYSNRGIGTSWYGSFS
jgi:hypothetical protein